MDNSTLVLSGSLAAVALICYLLVPILFRFRTSGKRAQPPIGALVKLLTREASYETHFRGIASEGWAMESLAHAIPRIRMNEPVLVEVSCRGGVLRFRSEVVELRLDSEVMVMRPPIGSKVGERRTRKRISWEQRPRVSVDGTIAFLLDVGEGGARLGIDQAFRRGERVKIVATNDEVALAAHVIDARHVSGRGFTHEVRVVFEEPQSLRAVKKKFAPAR